MVDLVYKTLLTLLNKEQQGYVSPAEFNVLANNVQEQIFREYFEDYNRDELKANRGMTSKGYANLSFNQRQRINQFSKSGTIAVTSGLATLPSDLYLIEDDGILTGAAQTYPNKVVEEVERGRLGYLNQSDAAPSALYPVYERFADSITVSPSSITNLQIRYLRKPKQPNWTYFTVATGDPLFNPADSSYQDFELHESEFSNIVLRMLSHFGLNLREADVIKVAETLQDKLNVKDNG